MIDFIDERGELIPAIACAHRCVAYGAGLAGGLAGGVCSLSLATVGEDGCRLLVGGSQVALSLLSTIDSNQSLRNQSHAPSRSTGAPRSSVTDNNDGTYSLSYSTAEPGKYQLHVTVGGMEVAGSPWSVEIRPGIPVPSRSKVALPEGWRTEPEPSSVQKGQHSVTVYSCDEFGNKSYSPGVRVGARGGGGVRVKEVRDFENGSYLVVFDVSGDGRLDCLMDGVHVVNSPLGIVTGPEVSRDRAMSDRVERAILNREDRLREREEDLLVAARKLRGLRAELDERTKGVASSVDFASVPPLPTVGTKIELKDVKKNAPPDDLQHMVLELERNFQVVRQKERALDRLIVEVNEHKLSEEKRLSGLLTNEPQVNDKGSDSLRSSYFRRDMFLQDRQDDLRRVLQRRKKESEAGIEGFDVGEAMRRASFLRSAKIRADLEMDAESKILFSIDHLFATFASAVDSGQQVLSLSDSVRLSNSAGLPLDNSEVVEGFIAFINKDESSKFVNKKSFVAFLLILARLVFREKKITDEDALAKLFETHFFRIIPGLKGTL